MQCRFIARGSRIMIFYTCHFSSDSFPAIQSWAWTIFAKASENAKVYMSDSTSSSFLPVNPLASPSLVASVSAITGRSLVIPVRSSLRGGQNERLLSSSSKCAQICMGFRQLEERDDVGHPSRLQHAA